MTKKTFANEMVSAASTSLRDSIGGVLRSNRLAALLEVILVISIYALKITGLLPASKIPILLIGSLSLWLRKSGWRQVGMEKPIRWSSTILLGVGISLLDTLVGWFVTLPLLHRITGEMVDLRQFKSIRGSIGDLLTWLVLSWTYAAIAEEMVFRGYFLNRLADLCGHSKWGWAVGVFTSSLVFGLAHSSMGITGVLNTTLTGILYAAAYLVFGRNLWLPVIIHGAGNTIGMLILYFGLYPW